MIGATEIWGTLCTTKTNEWLRVGKQFLLALDPQVTKTTLLGGK